MRDPRDPAVFALILLPAVIVARFAGVAVHEILGHGLASLLSGGTFYAVYVSPGQGAAWSHLPGDGGWVPVVLAGIAAELLLGCLLLVGPQVGPHAERDEEETASDLERREPSAERRREQPADGGPDRGDRDESRDGAGEDRGPGPPSRERDRRELRLVPELEDEDEAEGRGEEVEALHDGGQRSPPHGPCAPAFSIRLAESPRIAVSRARFAPRSILRLRTQNKSFNSPSESVSRDGKHAGSPL